MFRLVRNLFEVAGAISLLLAIGAGTVAGALLAAAVSLPPVPLAFLALGVAILVAALVLGALEAMVPGLEAHSRVDYEMVDLGNGAYGYNSRAIIVIRNARDRGGTRGVARGVTPEIEILDPRGGVVTRYVGWDNCAQRDFRPTREEHTVWIAYREHGGQSIFATLPGPEDRFMLGWGCSFEVRLTLRGENLRRPIVRTFSLTTDLREPGGLELRPV